MTIYRKLGILLAIILLAIGLFLLPTITLELVTKPFITDEPQASTILIPGASVTTKEPSPILKQRLDKGLEIWRKDHQQPILLTGSKIGKYNEPARMNEYIEDKFNIKNMEWSPEIPAKNRPEIIIDENGHRTISSCFNARLQYQQQSVIIVTQDFHLPRTIFLCRAAGLEVQGVAADNASNNPLQTFYFRELLANWIAIFDIIGYRLSG